MIMCKAHASDECTKKMLKRRDWHELTLLSYDHSHMIPGGSEGDFSTALNTGAKKV